MTIYDVMAVTRLVHPSPWVEAFHKVKMIVVRVLAGSDYRVASWADTEALDKDHQSWQSWQDTCRIVACVAGADQTWGCLSSHIVESLHPPHTLASCPTQTLHDATIWCQLHSTVTSFKNCRFNNRKAWRYYTKHYDIALDVRIVLILRKRERQLHRNTSIITHHSHLVSVIKSSPLWWWHWNIYLICT